MRAGWREPVLVEHEIDEATGADLLRDLFQQVYERPRGTGDTETWHCPLLPLLQNAAGHLRGVERVIVFPRGSGFLLPWAVLAEQAGWHTSRGEPVVPVTLPALALLPLLRRRPVREAGPALVVGNVRGDLLLGEDEAREIADFLHTDPLIGPQATRRSVLERLPGAAVVHFVTHAYFVPGSPLDSGIHLADGDLTAREVLRHRLRADLVVLSACETGRMGALAGDEVAGLAAAFLQSGARTVLMSLWPVDDLATASLMSTFYEECVDCQDKAMALSRAMAIQRDVPNQSHPYWWGGFALLGEWSGSLPRRPTTGAQSAP